ncbi:MAG: response regulator [Byssovorax sp.]
MGQHALIADSEPAHAVIYASILKHEGVHPILVRDGAAVIAALLDRGPPALAVIDLALGLDLIERIRRMAPATTLPIIVVSALRMERDLATVHRARLGLSAILAKAASEESFRRVARRLLGITPSDDLETPPASRAAIAPESSEPFRGDSTLRRCADGAPPSRDRAQQPPSGVSAQQPPSRTGFRR